MEILIPFLNKIFLEEIRRNKESLWNIKWKWNM